ncbi:methylated-DNA--[protein]-cysteine S-methyltransferase [Indiicoccus explosivorum]|uniref:methylated-DNA--[protein]-cysteine S-methyltransferase n=1 Tax=Indiicoccus explosivorum TaxID=1917864 RepID=UPI000B430766|nr:methylated-DNA--[protein]-cysteine S-methyltransferase [Indiicoccus explosivorum]
MLTETVETPIEPVVIRVEDGAVTQVDFGEPVFSGEGTPEERAVMDKAKQQLEEYFSGTREQFELPLSVKGTDFQERVWQELQRIPFGQAISYQELAERIGNPKAMRAVGQANRRNPIGIIIPCHRVIGKDKKLVGYAGNKVSLKEGLLVHEKVIAPPIFDKS